MKQLAILITLLLSVISTAIHAEEIMSQEDEVKTKRYLEMISVYLNIETLPIVITACGNLDSKLGEVLLTELNQYKQKHSSTYAEIKSIIANPESVDWLTNETRENAKGFNQFLAQQKKEMTEEYLVREIPDKREFKFLCNLIPAAFEL
ncbi:hypothetical protein ACMXYV_06710 [Neptuniibacter sp. SY11_33]|uniref:hypothetical protein n=1 Tax=Neptuniibacter sp. SY11_33 TaxID=3398215 RepID=UPI0039F4D8D1